MMTLKKKLEGILKGLISRRPRNQPTTSPRKYQALLPETDPEQFEKYAEAFQTVVEEPVSCVAITGPYGAGKTSLLNAFINAYPQLKVKPISLATFEVDSSETQNPKDVLRRTSDQIEKSILQQLIYGVPPNGLPYSRFKKIQKPSWLWPKSLILTLFGLSTGWAVKYWGKIESYFTFPLSLKEQWLGGIFVLLWISVVIVILRQIFRLSFGISLKKLSLKNAEIETGERSNESVFNKHLDELIYFFQETKYDLVIIEDLDRFENTEIFTKIREINQLINENEAIKKRRRNSPIKFLFAIRDDLFKGKDRTKFFDFIIPVIPFVSSGNSYEILLRHLKKSGQLPNEMSKTTHGLSLEFLRTISIHINDNRHLLNTVNEYALYRENLIFHNNANEHTTLDENKLFGMILYKNFYPDDFGALHDNKGVFAKLVADQRQQLAERQRALEAEHNEIDQAVEDHAASVLQSRSALAAAYIGAICCKSPYPVKSIKAQNNSSIALNADPSEILEFVRSSKNISAIHPNNYSNYTVASEDLGEKVHPGFTLGETLQRMEDIDADGALSIKSRRARVREELREVRYLSLSNSFSLSELKERSTDDFENNALFVYLVSNKYLDNDFENYTSYFHEGAISTNDRNFILNFHAGGTIGFDTHLDNPGEIVSILGDSLFGKVQGFNVQIVDYVLKNKLTLEAKMIAGFREAKESALEFMECYYLTGADPKKLTGAAITHWDSFIEIASQSEAPLHHVRSILSWVSDDTIDDLSECPTFLKFVQVRSSDVFETGELVEKIPLIAGLGGRLMTLDFKSLNDDERTTAIKTATESKAWAINPLNIVTIYSWIGVSRDQARANVFSKLGASAPLQEFIHENIDTFVEKCFLKITESVDETQEGMEALLSADGLNEELVPRLVERQNARLRFSCIPQNCWNTIVEHKKYVITWENFEHLQSTAESLLEPVFSDPEAVKKLSTSAQHISAELFDFLINFDSMEDERYRGLISPELGTVEELPPALSRRKKLHLIETKMVELSEESFSWVGDNSELKVALIQSSLQSYMSTIAEWSLTNQDVGNLLKAEIPKEHKFTILCRAEGISWDDDSEYLEEVSAILADGDFSLESFDDDFCERVINETSQQDGLKILNRKIGDWDESTVMQSLSNLGSPYEQIAQYGKRPLIPKTSDSETLVQRLKKFEFISSYDTEKKGLRINTKKLPE